MPTPKCWQARGTAAWNSKVSQGKCSRLKRRALEPPSSVPRVEWSCHHETTDVRGKATNQLCRRVWTRSFGNLKCFIRGLSGLWMLAAGWEPRSQCCFGKERGLQSRVARPHLGTLKPSSPSTPPGPWARPSTSSELPSRGLTSTALGVEPGPAPFWLRDPGQWTHELSGPH